MEDTNRTRTCRNPPLVTNCPHAHSSRSGSRSGPRVSSFSLIVFLLLPYFSIAQACVALPPGASDDSICYQAYQDDVTPITPSTVHGFLLATNATAPTLVSINALRGMSVAQSDVLSLLMWTSPLPSIIESSILMDESLVYRAEDDDRGGPSTFGCSNCIFNGSLSSGGGSAGQLAVPFYFNAELDVAVMESYTVSFSFQRVSTVVKGFAFIVCEGGYWGYPTPLSKLVDDFPNDVATNAVYYSVYLDSEAGSISWLSRDAGARAFSGETFFVNELKATSGVQQAGTLDIFDGEWHQVAFTVSPSSDNQFTLQLLIDGRTSEAKEWTRCLYDLVCTNTGIPDELASLTDKPTSATPQFINAVAHISPSTVTGASFEYLGWLLTLGSFRNGDEAALFNFQVHQVALTQRQVIAIASNTFVDALSISKRENFQIAVALCVVGGSFLLLVGIHAYAEVFGVSLAVVASTHKMSSEATAMASASGGRVAKAVGSAKGVAAQVAQISSQSALRSSSLSRESSITAPLRQIQTITPYIVVVWQNLSMYLRVWSWPPQFSSFISKLVIVFALDFTVPELRITPVATFFTQLAIGLLLLFFIYRIAIKDRSTFRSAIVRFRASLELSFVLAEEVLASQEEGISQEFLRSLSPHDLRRVVVAYVTQRTPDAVVQVVSGLAGDEVLCEKVVSTVVVKLTQVLRTRDPMELLLTIFVYREQIRLSEADTTVVAAQLYTMCASLNDLTPEDLEDEYRIDVFEQAVAAVNRRLPTPMRATSARLMVGMLRELAEFIRQSDEELAKFYAARCFWGTPDDAAIRPTRILSLKELRRSVYEALGQDPQEYRLWLRMAKVSESGVATPLPDRTSLPKPQYTVHLRECHVDPDTDAITFLIPKERASKTPHDDDEESCHFGKIFKIATTCAFSGAQSARKLHNFLQCAHRLVSSPALKTVGVASVDVVDVRTHHSDRPKVVATWEHVVLVRHNGELLLKVGCSSLEKDQLSQVARIRRAASSLWGEMARVKQRVLKSGRRTSEFAAVGEADDSPVASDDDSLRTHQLDARNISVDDSTGTLFHVEIQSPLCLYCPQHQTALIEAPETVYQRRYGDGSRPFDCAHSRMAGYKQSTRARSTAEKFCCGRGTKDLLGHLTTVQEISSSSSDSSSEEDGSNERKNVRKVRPVLRKRKSDLSTKTCPPVISCDADKLLVCRYLCGYTVCSTCADLEYRTWRWYADSAMQLVYVKAQEGQLIFVLLFVAAQSMLYPITQNCFMVLACHPIFRCDFPHCYDDPSASFIVAVVLALVVLIFFRVGIAMLWTAEIAGRKLFLNGLFRGSPASKSQSQSTAASWCSSFVSAIASSGDTVMWDWFLTMDTSIMSSLYRKLEFPYMAMDPLLQLALQCALSVLSSFSVPDSLEQVIAIASVECCYCLFLSIANMYTDPWLDILAKLGSVHQILQIAWLSFHRKELFANPSSVTFAFVMIGTAVVYICIVVAITFHTVVTPWLSAKMEYLQQAYLRREETARHEGNLTTREERLEVILKEKQKTYGADHFQCVITRAVLARNHWEWGHDRVNANLEIVEVVEDFTKVLHSTIERIRANTTVSTNDAVAQFDIGGYLLDNATLETLREVLILFSRIIADTAEQAVQPAAKAEQPSGDAQPKHDDDAAVGSNHMRQSLIDTLWNMVMLSRDFPKEANHASANAIMLLCALQAHSGSCVLRPFVDRDLSGVSIAGADLTGAAFIRVLFRDANLTGVKFERCFFEDVDFTDAVINNCTFGMQLSGNRSAFSASPFECSVGCGVLITEELALIADVENIGLRFAFLDERRRYDDALITGHAEIPIDLKRIYGEDPFAISVDAAGMVIVWRNFAGGRSSIQLHVLCPAYLTKADVVAPASPVPSDFKKLRKKTSFLGSVMDKLGDLIGFSSDSSSSDDELEALEMSSSFGHMAPAVVKKPVDGGLGSSVRANMIISVCPCVSIAKCGHHAVAAAMSCDQSLCVYDCEDLSAATWATVGSIPLVRDFNLALDSPITGKDLRFALLCADDSVSQLHVVAGAYPQRGSSVTIIMYHLPMNGGQPRLKCQLNIPVNDDMRKSLHGGSTLLLEQCGGKQGLLACVVCGTLRVYHAATAPASDEQLKLVWETAMRRSGARISAITCTNSEFLVVGHTSGLLLVYRIELPSFPQVFSYQSTAAATARPVQSLYQMGLKVLCCYENSNVELINVQINNTTDKVGVIALPLPTYHAMVNDIALSPDGDTLAVCNNSPTVDLVYMTDDYCGHLTGHSDEVSCIAFSGLDIISISKDGTANWWRSGKKCRIEMPSDIVTKTSELYITGDGCNALCCGFDQVWCFGIHVEELVSGAVGRVMFNFMWDTKAPQILPQCCFFTPDHLHVAVYAVSERTRVDSSMELSTRHMQSFSSIGVAAPAMNTATRHTVTWFDVVSGVEVYTVNIPYLFPALTPDAQDEIVFCATPDGRFLCGCSGQEYFVFSLVDGTMEEYVTSTDATRRLENIIVAPKSAQCVLVRNFTNDPISLHWPGRESVDITHRNLHRIGFVESGSRIVGFNRQSNAIEGFDVNTVQLPCRYIADGFATELQDEPADEYTRPRISAAAVSFPDGTTLTTVARSRQVSLFDVRTGRLLGTTSFFTTHHGVEGTAVHVLAPVQAEKRHVDNVQGGVGRFEGGELGLDSQADFYHAEVEVPDAPATVRSTTTSGNVSPVRGAGRRSARKKKSQLQDNSAAFSTTTPLILIFTSKGGIMHFCNVLDELMVVEHITEDNLSCRVHRLPTPSLSACVIDLTDVSQFALGTFTGTVLLMSETTKSLVQVREISVGQHPVTCVAPWRLGFLPHDDEAVIGVGSCDGIVRFIDIGASPSDVVPPPVQVEAFDASAAVAALQPLTILIHPAGHLMMVSSKARVAVYQMQVGSAHAFVAAGDRYPNFEAPKWSLRSERVKALSGSLFRPRAFAVPFHYTDLSAPWDPRELLIRGSRQTEEGAKISFAALADGTKQTFRTTPGATQQVMVSLVGGITILVDDKDVVFYNEESPRLAIVAKDAVVAPIAQLHNSNVEEQKEDDDLHAKSQLVGLDTLTACHEGVLQVDGASRKLVYLGHPWYSEGARPLPIVATERIPAVITGPPGIQPPPDDGAFQQSRSTATVDRHNGGTVHILVSDAHYSLPTRPTAVVMCISADGAHVMVARYRLPTLATEVVGIRLQLEQAALGPHDVRVVCSERAALSADGKLLAVLLAPVGADAPAVDVAMGIFSIESGEAFIPAPLHLNTVITRFASNMMWRSSGGYDTDTPVALEAIGTTVDAASCCHASDISDVSFNADASMIAISFGSSGFGVHVIPLEWSRQQMLYKDRGILPADVLTISAQKHTLEFAQTTHWPHKWWKHENREFLIKNFGNLPLPISWASLEKVSVHSAYIIPAFDYMIVACHDRVQMCSLRAFDEFHMENETPLSSFPTGMAVKMSDKPRRSLMPPSRVAVTVGEHNMLEVFTIHQHTGAFIFVYRSASTLLAAGLTTVASVSPSRASYSHVGEQRCTLRFETVQLRGIERREDTASQLLAFDADDLSSHPPSLQHHRGPSALHKTQATFFATDNASIRDDPDVFSATGLQRKKSKKFTQVNSDHHPPVVMIFHHRDSTVELYPHADVREMKYHPSNPNFFVGTIPSNLVRNVVHSEL